MPDYSTTGAVFPLKTYAITDVDTGTEQFVIDGDQTERFQDGDEFSVVGSTGNDGAYTVASTSYSEVNDETTITVNEDITDATVDGTIVHGEVADSLPITEAHDDAADRDAAAPEEYAGAHGRRLANELRALGKTAGEVLGMEVVDGGGLVVYYTGAKVLKGSGTPVFVAPGRKTLTDNDDNYVEVNVAGTVSSNVVGFTTGKYPLAIVTTLAGIITAIVDARSAIYLAEFAEANLDDFGPSFNGGTELTISGGVITRTQGVHLVDTEGDAPTDNLDTINGGAADMMLFVRASHTDRTVVLRDGIGNLELAGSNITLDDIDQFVLLLYDGTLSKWVVVGGAGGGAAQLSDLSDVSSVLYTAGFVLRADGAGFVAAQLGHGDLSSVSSSQHHARYADGEAVSAMGAKADGNPLNHDRYTDPEAAIASAALKLDDHATPDDNTDLDFDTSRHGLTPKGTDVGNFLKDDGTWAAPTVAGVLKADGSVDIQNSIYEAATELTIVAGTVARTQAVHTIDTQGDAPTDDLDSISGGADGLIVRVRAENVARTVVLKHGTGNLELGGSDITLNELDKYIELQYDSVLSKWLLVGEPATLPVGEAVSFEIGHGEILDGLSDDEFHRFQLQAGETFTLTRLELQLKGGGTNANVSVNVYDSTGASQMDSVTAGLVSVSGGISTAVALILVRVSNSSGGDVNATIIVHGYITPAPELVALSMGHGEIPDALSNEEIHRFQLQGGEVFTLSRIELQLKGGGTNANVSVDVYDSTGVSVIDSVTAGAVSVTGGVSGVASLILVRLTNSSGTDVEGTIIVHGKITS